MRWPMRGRRTSVGAPLHSGVYRSRPVVPPTASGGRPRSPSKSQDRKLFPINADTTSGVGQMEEGEPMTTARQSHEDPIYRIAYSFAIEAVGGAQAVFKSTLAELNGEQEREGASRWKH